MSETERRFIEKGQYQAPSDAARIIHGIITDVGDDAAIWFLPGPGRFRVCALDYEGEGSEVCVGVYKADVDLAALETDFADVASEHSATVDEPVRKRRGRPPGSTTKVRHAKRVTERVTETVTEFENHIPTFIQPAPAAVIDGEPVFPPDALPAPEPAPPAPEPEIHGPPLPPLPPSTRVARTAALTPARTTRRDELIVQKMAITAQLAELEVFHMLTEGHGIERIVFYLNDWDELLEGGGVFTDDDKDALEMREEVRRLRTMLDDAVHIGATLERAAALLREYGEVLGGWGDRRSKNEDEKKAGLDAMECNRIAALLDGKPEDSNA